MHMQAHLDIDMVALEVDETVTVMLDLTAPTASDAGERPAQAVIAVLDRSGSMAGHRLESCKRALTDLVGRLRADDAFGLVVFDDQAQVVVPADSVDTLGRAQIRQSIASVHPGGTTDLSSGYFRGLQEAARSAGRTGATIVLLSDGHANTGLTDPGILRELARNAARQSITTSSIGIGTDYDDAILSELAIGGSGNHTFALEGDAAAAAVAGEIAGLLSKTVQAASLRITPGDDVTAIGVVNDLPSHTVPGGVEVELGDCYAGEHRRVLVQLTVPGMPSLGLAQIANLALTYVALPALETQVVTLPVSVNVVPADVAKGQVPDAAVHVERLLLDVQRAKKAGEEALRRGDPGTARQLLSQARQDLEDAPPLLRTGEVVTEMELLTETIETLDAQDAALTSKHLSASRAKRSRGHVSRGQGGEISGEPQQPGGDAQGPEEGSS